MGLEAATHLEDLNVANPDGASDTKAQGDDHIRLMKTVLKNTFPGFAGRIGRVQTKVGNYGGILTDNFTTLSFSVEATLSLAAAATLGNGWSVNVYASGGDVTVDPNGAELVNGVATYVIRKGSMAILVCDGGGFILIEMLPAASGFSTGDAKLTMKTVADPGWIMANDGSIGSVASAATTRANADTEDLYVLLWTNYANTEAPTQDNTGTPVARGASAVADFAANKRLVIPKTLGRALAIAGSGAGLTARALGLATGSEDAVLVSHNHTGSGNTGGQSADHSHTYWRGGIGPNGGNGWTGSGVHGQEQTTGASNDHSHAFSFTTSTQGESATGKNMQPTSFAFNAMIKL